MKKINKVLIVLIVLVIVIFVAIYIFVPKDSKNIMIDLVGKTKEEAVIYADEHNLNLEIKEENNSFEINKIFKQSIDVDTEIKENDNLIIYISKGIDYNALKVDESGNVPIMMYHGIHNVTDNEYIGGNVDKDGYQRTASAFRNDLEFYYNSGYRMIRLEDYVNGIIDVEAGYSPIIITFDDGLSNNLKVTGLDSNGNIIIDPNCAVGVLESFKENSIFGLVRIY